MENIHATDRTEVPTYLALLSEGFRVERQKFDDGKEHWIAERNDLMLSGYSLLEVLGLYSMRDRRGGNWGAEDAETTAFITRFFPKGRR